MNTKTWMSGLTLALTGTLIATSANAATSSASARAIAPGLMDKITLSYTNVFYGASLGNPLNDQGPDPYTPGKEEAMPLLMKNYITPGYKLTDTIRAEAVLYFQATPVHGGTLKLKDPYLRLSDSKAINAGNLNVYADLRMAPGVSPGSRDQSRIGYVATKQVATYSIPKSRFTVGAQGFLERDFFSNKKNAAKAGAFESELFVGPMVEYKLAPALSASAMYNLDWYNFAGTDLVLTHYLELGMSIDATSNLNISPFMYLQTNKQVSFNTTQIGASLSWKLL